jgi:hypothetical protein
MMVAVLFASLVRQPWFNKPWFDKPWFDKENQRLAH